MTHLCEEHARGHLQKDPHTPVASITNALAKQLKLGQTKAELEQLDMKECPVCGITFFEFRSNGRLGCPYDYTHFEADLTPLLINIHDATEHRGKKPRRAAGAAGAHAEMISLRREMEDAVEREDYERASQLRDQLRGMESQNEDNKESVDSGNDSTTGEDDS